MGSTRRDFIEKTAGASAIVAAGATLPGMSAESYNRIKGANNRIRVAVSVVNARGSVLAKSFASQSDCQIVHVCNVDSHASAKCVKMLEKAGSSKPKVFTDIRKSLNSKNPSGNLDVLHIHNLFDGVREGKPLKADVTSGHKSTLLVQLGNIAQRTGNSLNIDPKNGHIINNPAAQKLWSRTYEPGWEMKL